MIEKQVQRRPVLEDRGTVEQLQVLRGEEDLDAERDAHSTRDPRSRPGRQRRLRARRQNRNCE